MKRFFLAIILLKLAVVYFSTLLNLFRFVKLIAIHSSTEYMEFDSFWPFGLFCAFEMNAILCSGWYLTFSFSLVLEFEGFLFA